MRFIQRSNDKYDPRKFFSRRNCDCRFRPVVRDRDGCRLRGPVAAQLVAWRSLRGRWTGGLAVLFLVAALLYPAALKPLNRLWLKFGLLLHKVVNPIMMALRVLRRGAADRPRHAGAGQGSASAQTGARREQLLDRTAPARAGARIHEGPVLRGKQYGLPG